MGGEREIGESKVSVEEDGSSEPHVLMTSCIAALDFRAPILLP